MKDITSKIYYIIQHEGLLSIVKRPYCIIIKLVNQLLIGIFCFFPVIANKIILESQVDYSDNVRAFYEYASKNKDNPFHFIWLVQNPSYYKNRYEGTFVSRNELFINIRADYHIATAGYLIFSHPYWLKKWRKNQTVINTTHSVAQLKATSNGKSKKTYDYVLTCSDYCTEVRKQTFHDYCDSHYLCIGQPRIDLLFSHEDCLKKLFPNMPNKKIILCMETFKQTTSWNDGGANDIFSLNVISSISELKKLDQYLFDNDYILINKIHHLQDLSVINSVNLSRIVYITDSDLRAVDIQVNQLLENAVLLLTDYSSVFYEFLLLDRPIGFLIGDIDEYKRGFIIENPLDEMPGKAIKEVE